MGKATPVDWISIRLQDVIEILSGYPFESNFFCDDSKFIGVIRIRNLLDHQTQTYYSGEYEQTYVITLNDILIGMDGDFHIVKWKGSDSLLNQRICKINCRSLNLI